MFDALHKLSVNELRDLAGLCRQSHDGTLPPLHAIQQIAGAELGALVARELVELAGHGWRPDQFAAVAKAIAEASVQHEFSPSECDLVLSGPEAAGIPTRDTAAVMHALLAEAQQEVLLVGYAFHNTQALFHPLAERLALEQGLRVWLCVDISRKPTDTSLASEIVRRFSQEFWSQHWIWTPRPELYYDPRSLDVGGAGRSSLHAKCIVIDREAALVTSANFTDAAQHRNIECGVIIRNANICQRIADYFEALCQMRTLVKL
jgi:phosphatidylserine/phosphatidylglycerophosphate/cardiolipin synthase-like enzyme